MFGSLGCPRVTPVDLHPAQTGRQALQLVNGFTARLAFT